MGRDTLAMAWQALRAHRLRTRMTYAAISIGIASVILLTSLGEGARAWVVESFESLGSSVLLVMPGRTETRGSVPMAPASTRDITLEDARALERRFGARSVVPITLGEMVVSTGRRSRAAVVIGATSEYLGVRNVTLEQGRSLPDGDFRNDTRVCLLGRTLRRELFPDDPPVGARVRLGGYPFRVAGIIGSEGQSMMVNLDEVALVPVASALKMFNISGIFRLLVKVPPTSSLARAEAQLTEVLRDRHDGEVDFTVVSPGAVADALSGVVGIITAAVAGIAAVSLAVAGIGVMNVMVVSVTERTREIGLMKALGASNGQVLRLFLAEAVVLSLTGGALGLLVGAVLTRVARGLLPDMPFEVPAWSAAASVALSAAVGLGFGILPARRASRLDPLEALRKR